MPPLLLLSLLGQTCAVGASIARFDGAPELESVQVVMCTMIMVNWDRVQQPSTIPWFGRTVVTFGPMEDGSSLPVDPSFRWLSKIDLLILEGNEYSRESIGRFDVAAFEVTADRLGHGSFFMLGSLAPTYGSDLQLGQTVGVPGMGRGVGVHRGHSGQMATGGGQPIHGVTSGLDRLARLVGRGTNSTSRGSSPRSWMIRLI